MPGLGKYALAVLGAYGAAIVLMAALILLSIHQSRRARRELARLQERATTDGTE